MTINIHNPKVAATVSGLPAISAEPVTVYADDMVNTGTLACFDTGLPESISQTLDPVPSATSWLNVAAINNGPARTLMPTGEVDLISGASITRDAANGFDFDAGDEYLEGITAVRDYVAANNDHGYFFSYWFKLNEAITNATAKFSFVGGLGPANGAGDSMILMYMDHSATNSFVFVVNGMRLTTTVTPGDLVHVAGVHDYPNGSGIVYLNGSVATASPAQSALFGNLQFGSSPYWNFRIGPDAPINPADWQISQDNARFSAYRYVMEDLTVSGRDPADVIAAERASGLAKSWAA